MNGESSIAQGPLEVHIYQVENRDFALDINNGNFFELDPVARGVLIMHGAGRKKDEIMKDLSRHFNEKAVTEALVELDNLKTRGNFQTPIRTQNDLVQDRFEFNTICMMISQDCNLRCRYCYADSGTYGQDRSLMSEKTAERCVDFLFEHSGESRLLSIIFFGGEPLLNVNVLKHTVDYARQLASSAHKEIGFSITTNGTLLSGNTLDFLVSNDIGISVSIDGQPATHDTRRQFQNGQGSYYTIENNLKEYNKKAGIGRFSIRGTIARRDTDYVQTVEHLMRLGSDNIAMELCFCDNQEIGIQESDLAHVKAQYRELAKEFIKAEKKGRRLPFPQIEDVMGAISQRRIRTTPCGAGNFYLSISAVGGIYPCHRLVGNEQYRVGDVSSGISRPEIIRQFAQTQVTEIPKCASCWARYLCGGGCRAEAIKYNNDFFKPHEIECDIFRYLVELSTYAHSELRR